MRTRQIKQDIYWVGTLNPAMRIFDIIMTTEYGTSYNSYIVKGTEKTALIETSHAHFSEKYFDNIREVCEPKDIHYIVLNHCEPDHSGALHDLLQLCPNAEIVVSKPGSLYLKAITNREDVAFKVVKNGDTLSLGGKELSFFIAPFLHWPDSMFTYIAQDKTLFSCDFLGAHYCEPYVLDSEIEYEAKYKTAMKNYYDAIFGPFSGFVRAGLDIIKGLDYDTVCNSHGPVLTKGNMLEYVVAQYQEWSKAEERNTVPVFFCSAYGNTKQIAEKIAEGIRDGAPSLSCSLYDLNDVDMNEAYAVINAAKAFAIGSPTINSDAVLPVWDLLGHVDAIGNRNRPVLAFGSYGWSGEGVPNMISRLEGLKSKLYGTGFKVNFVPNEEDLNRAYALGKEFAESLK